MNQSKRGSLFRSKDGVRTLYSRSTRGVWFESCSLGRLPRAIYEPTQRDERDDIRRPSRLVAIDVTTKRRRRKRRKMSRATTWTRARKRKRRIISRRRRMYGKRSAIRFIFLNESVDVRRGERSRNESPKSTKHCSRTRMKRMKTTTTTTTTTTARRRRKTTTMTTMTTRKTPFCIITVPSTMPFSTTHQAIVEEEKPPPSSLNHLLSLLLFRFFCAFSGST